MKLRALRRKLATLIGLVIAAFALVWVLFIDTKVKVDVKWMFAAMLMLISGGGLMLGSYFLQNPESKAWVIFDVLCPIFQGGFVVTQLFYIINKVGIDNKKIGVFGKQIFPIIILVVGIAGAIMAFAATIIDIILYFKIDRKKTKI